ncbi:MAG: hypothetical protein QXO74_03700 [Candidatus Methanomethylicia archaeon]
MYYDESVLKSFKLKFKFKGKSWINRCIERLSDIIETDHPNVWFVKGRIEFGDYNPFYKVVFFSDFKCYFCTCYSMDKRYYLVRMRDICTHIGSVILWRMLRGELFEKYRSM